MKLSLVLGVLAATAAQDPAPPPDGGGDARLQGVIHSAQDGRRAPLPFALVEVLLPGGRHSVMADRGGRYHLDEVPAGRVRVRASHVGHESIEVDVLVPSTGVVETSLVLQTRPVALPELRVVAGRAPPIEVPGGEVPLNPVAAQLVGLRAMESSPGMVEAGLGSAVGAPPGSEPQDPTDILLMRGSTADLKLVLLDGAPVYTPFHTGGLFEGFQVATLGTAAHHVGGAPARYDGGLSYVLDLRTRPGRQDRVRGSGSLDLLGFTGGIEAPLGTRGSLLASGRGLHGAGSRLMGGQSSPYGYGELLARADLGLGSAGALAATGFTNREAVRLGGSDSPAGPRLDEASWGNDALSVRWRSRPGRSVDWEIGAAASAYRAELPVSENPDPGTLTGSGPAASAVRVASGTTERARLTADLWLHGVADGLTAGVSLDRTKGSYGSRSVDRSTAVRTRGTVFGAYAERLHDLGGEVDLRYGLRLDRFGPGGFRVAPRLALLWSLAPDALLTVAGGRYHQLTRLGDGEVELLLGDPSRVGTLVDTPNGSRELLGVATADHLTLGLDQEITDGVRLDFEGYLKRFQDLGPTGPTELASSGADLSIVRQGETMTGWLGYSLAWFWTPDDPSGAFSGRHLLSAGLRGTVVDPVGLELRAAFSDGLPLTAIQLGDEANRSFLTLEAEDGQPPPLPDASRTAGFLRIDAEVFARWSGEWGSRTWSVRPYLKLLNALDRRDSLFYYFEPWRDEGVRPLAELSLLPVVGLEWRF